MGSISAGKIANLVVTDGDIFGEKTKVKDVFVDGNWFEIHEEAPAAKPDDKKPAGDDTRQRRGVARARGSGPMKRANLLKVMLAFAAAVAIVAAPLATRAQNPGGRS